MSLSHEDRENIGGAFWLIFLELQDLKDEVRKLTKRESMDLATIQQELADQQTAIQANTDGEASAITLLNSLSALILANLNDPAALQAIADSIAADNTQLQTNNATLAAAVVANTPAAPAPAG